MEHDEIEQILNQRELTRTLTAQTRAEDARKAKLTKQREARETLEVLAPKNLAQEAMLRNVFETLSPIVLNWKSKPREGRHLSFNFDKVRDKYRQSHLIDDDGHEGKAWKATRALEFSVEDYRRPSLYLYCYMPGFSSPTTANFRYQVTADDLPGQFQVIPQSYDDSHIWFGGDRQTMAPGWTSSNIFSRNSSAEKDETFTGSQEGAVKFLMERLADHVERTRGREFPLSKNPLKDAVPWFVGLILVLGLSRCW